MEGAADQFIAIYHYHSGTVRRGTLFTRLGQCRMAKSARDFLMATATNDSDPEMQQPTLRVLTERLSGGRRPLVQADGPATGEGNLDAAPGPAFDRDDSSGSGHEAPFWKADASAPC